ncbi:MAG: hypothetical protein J0L84_17000 [Verrucomicrobia bacterium]|nr:hypothetical protein [Verrucomicrobiota bacterium]
MQATLRRRSGLGAILWVAAALGIGAFRSAGENPSWRGAPFRCVFTNGNLLPDLAQASTPVRIVTAETALFLYSTVPGGRRGTTRPAVHGFDGTVWRSVLHDGIPGFTNLVSLHHVGLWERRALLFLPGIPAEPQPIYRWDGALTAWLPPEQAGTNPWVAGGRILRTEGSADAGMRIHLGPPGATVEILDDSIAPGLSGALSLDGDGQTVLFSTGSAARTNAVIWMRRTDGTLRRLIGEGDPMPEGSGQAAVRPGSTAVFADGSHAYLVVDNQTGGRQRDLDQVLFRSDGDLVEPLLALRSAPLGVAGTRVIAFTVGSVTGGEILATATLEGGRRTVIHWKAGVWSEVFAPGSAFDGESPFDFTLHRDGHLGDSLTLLLSFGSARRPVHRLYTNARFQTEPPHPRWLVESGAGSLPAFVLVGRSLTRHRILQSNSLGSWRELGVVRTSESGRWVLEPDATAGAAYYQAQELPGDQPPR